MANNSKDDKQNVTVRRDRKTIRKLKLIAARSSISLSELVARRIEIIFGEEESYERLELQARELLKRGFHMGAALELGGMSCMSGKGTGRGRFREPG